MIFMSYRLNLFSNSFRRSLLNTPLITVYVCLMILTWEKYTLLHILNFWNGLWKKVGRNNCGKEFMCHNKQTDRPEWTASEAETQSRLQLQEGKVKCWEMASNTPFSFWNGTCMLSRHASNLKFSIYPKMTSYSNNPFVLGSWMPNDYMCLPWHLTFAFSLGWKISQ